MKKLALFDFCETLVNFQTLAKFLEIIRENKLNPLFPNFTKHANVEFRELHGFPIEKANALSKDFLHQYLLPNVNENVLSRLLFHQKNGYEIAICSGGLSLYIKDFAAHFGVANVFAIDLKKRGGVLLGSIDGLHTMAHRKLYKLALNLDLKSFDLSGSYAYSDCPSDIPMLSLVGHPHVIECGKDTLWAHLLGYEII